MIAPAANTALIYGKDGSGNVVPIGVTAGAQATGTLTSNNVIMSDGDTVTIGSITYTFKTTLTPTEGQVLINGAADAGLLNLIRAINGTGSNGVDYYTKRLDGHPDVSAATSVTAHAFLVAARDAGVAGNSIATTETDGSTARLSWGATTLTGGTNASLGFSGSGTSLIPATGVVTVQNPAVTAVTSTALETSHVLKASAGQLCSLAIFNSKASAQFILIMNSTTVPSNGAVTLLYPPIPIAAASILVIDFPRPLVASTGISVANSSTGTFSLTIGSADCVFTGQIN